MSNFSQDNTRIQSVSVISATEIAEGWSANPMRQVVLYKDEDNYWIVECPSLKGCVSQGNTNEEALANIKEASTGYIAALEEDNLPIPEENLATPNLVW